MTTRYIVQNMSTDDHAAYYILDTQAKPGGQWIDTLFSFVAAGDAAARLNRIDSDPAFATWVIVNELRHSFYPTSTEYNKLLHVERTLAALTL